MEINRKWFKFDGIQNCPADVRMAYFSDEDGSVVLWVSGKNYDKFPAKPVQPGFMWFPQDDEPPKKVEPGEWLYYYEPIKSKEERENVK
jgi:hypothetical protein